ncbi:AAA domain-containing protein [Domibacillus sp. DTU_2020_1001157_1_SI_ALB_TIR_016]|uniref:AAA domain-containing protein n=1 Tax=Domibacillus sp. DTU_2020_1001157_1_SI_ALB_TIR_016 TaxID=3077789 RepID=UPI0028EE4311|nr:AAA domain-containing protein [Domibacillus sp. DTU_2020_1001157_1_SI_ALB_TIR_016]WNS82216.1 AAA domain-containing protein [Domibacillus sp. DTU_2020_1001157_1_SI_ALB_TIR_016]
MKDINSIKELQIGDMVNQFFSIESTEVKKGKNNKEFLKMTLQYGKHTIDAVKWNYTNLDKQIPLKDHAILVKGKVNDFNNLPQLVIESMKLDDKKDHSTSNPQAPAAINNREISETFISNERKVLEYFRSSIADAERISPNESQIHISLFEEYEILKSGVISSENCMKIFRKARQLSSEDPRRKKITNYVELIINPFVGYGNVLYGQEVNIKGAPKELVPFWVPSLLYEDGKLSPHPHYKPWVAREWLSADSSDSINLDYQVIGTVEAIDKFQSSSSTNIKSWDDLWTYIDQLSVAVTGEKVSELSHPTYTRGVEGQNCYIRLVDFSQGMTRNILGVYNDLMNKKNLPPLLNCYLGLEENEELDLLSEIEDIKMTVKHVGQMSNEFPVSSSQRQAIHHFLTMNEGEILAVNGPPGTGKTTMLQSIVATLWTSAAYNQTEPPVILAASTNNKAVTNVIDSFGKVVEVNYPALAGRWLPEIDSYGLYLVRESKEGIEDFQCYHPQNRDNFINGFPSTVENSEYLDRAEKYYIEKYKIFLQIHESNHSKTEESINDIEMIINDLHDKLTKSVHSINKQVEEYLENSSDKKFLETMDTKERYLAFKLATHYFEGKWLLEMKKELVKESNSLHELSKENQIKKWRRFAKLTPCLVSTMHMTPSFFKYGITATNYLYDFIDLLIVDEGGQVNPEIAAATFALAKKGLVVGDTVQIPPIWNIPLTIDIQNILKFGLGSNEEEAITFIEKTCLGASGGSVMKIAQRASKFRVDESLPRGMFLREHRRCVKDIISYCNELAYNGFLIPLAKEFEDNTYILPHMGYAHIEGKHSNTNGNSNELEAEQIISWIRKNKEILEKYYSHEQNKKVTIDEIVGIITPFTKQTSVFKNLIRKNKELAKITVGTVHALQGAERNICIFSPVYDVNHKGSYFFDNGVNMLNVAVSRAKHSFLVFGDTRIFQNANKSIPSHLLSDYLFASDKNKIKLSDKVEIPGRKEHGIEQR